MSLLDLLRGPRLYTRFRATLRDTNPIETVADNMFSFARGFWNFLTGFSPVVLAYLYSRGALTPQSFIPYANYVIVYAVVAFSARLIGRLMDLEYRSFVVCWSKARETGRPEDVFALKEYDFEIAGGPIDFVAVSRPDAWYVVPPDEELSANFLVKALSYFCVTSFGRRIMYPGSVSLLNYIMSGPINENRKLMVTAKGGQRVWMKSATDDTIDAMFVDMRKENVRGHTLVISCEGNAGFYEVGIANTPIQLGYSVLGWNHPGFAESTGIPMPANVFAAADAVMQYALGPLNFKPENIVLFGWSIGGFPASWLAANYPQVRALILDATFDDVLPLAIARMPSFAGPIVQHAVRAHLNLQIDKHVNHFDGPIRLIRRMQEEIIITDEMGTDEERRASNRANNLLKSLLVHRHPDIVKGLEPQIDRWLSMSPEQRIVAGGGRLSSGDGARVQRLFSLCDHYFVDFDSNHVTPLSPLYFNIPSPVLGR